MRLANKYRDNSVLLSGEVYTYLRILAERLVAGTEASITVDQFVDGYLREKITRENPELPELYEKLEKARAKAKKEYAAVEEEMGRAVRIESAA